MQFVCDYCGAVIDTETATKHCCPTCGASYEGNQRWEEGQKKKDKIDDFVVERERIETEKQQFRLDKEREIYEDQKKMQKSVSKIGKVIIGVAIGIAILTLLVMIAIPVLFLGTANNIQSNFKETQLDMMGMTTSSTLESTKQIETISVGDTFKSPKMEITVDECEILKENWKEPQEGFVNIRAHVIINNVQDKNILFTDDIFCTYEQSGAQVKAVKPTAPSSQWGLEWTIGVIEPNTAKQGWVYFTIPENTPCTIRIGNIVAINVSVENINSGEEK